VDLVSTAPAKLFGLYPRKGTIAIGSDADLVLWDPKKKVTLTNNLMHHRCDYTPWEGFEVVGYPVATYLRGEPIFQNGKVHGQPRGIHLVRPAYAMIEPAQCFPTPFNPVLGRVESLTDGIARI
jgi:dihydropyrimidinase